MPNYERKRTGNDFLCTTASNRDTGHDTSNRRQFMGRTTTAADGTATIHITDNGLIAGVALFSSIDSVAAMVARDTATAIQVPKIAIKTISADHKTIVFNVIVGTTINILVTPTEAFAPAGLIVYVTVCGE